MTIGRLSLRATPFGKGFIVLTFLVGLAAINTGNNLLYLILAAMCSLIVVSGILSEQTIWRLSVARRPPPHLFAGEPFTMEVTVTNRKRWLPSFCVAVEPHTSRAAMTSGAASIYSIGAAAGFLMLGPGETRTAGVTYTITRRGLHLLDGYRVATSFPFGLFHKAIARPEPLEVVVYPRLRPLRDTFNGRLRLLQAEHEVNRRGAGISLYNLRDYHEGDEARAIHWKTSARQARLMVTERARDEERRMTIVVSQALPEPPGPAGRHAAEHLVEAFERGVELAASFAEDFLMKGYAVRLLTVDRVTGYSADRGHLYRILRALALLQPLPHPLFSPAMLARLTPRSDEPALLIRLADDPVWAGRDSAFLEVVRIGPSPAGSSLAPTPDGLVERA